MAVDWYASEKCTFHTIKQIFILSIKLKFPLEIFLVPTTLKMHFKIIHYDY